MPDNKFDKTMQNEKSSNSKWHRTLTVIGKCLNPSHPFLLFISLIVIYIITFTVSFVNIYQYVSLFLFIPLLANNRSLPKRGITHYAVFNFPKFEFDFQNLIDKNHLYKL